MLRKARRTMVMLQAITMALVASAASSRQPEAQDPVTPEPPKDTLKGKRVIVIDDGSLTSKLALELVREQREDVVVMGIGPAGPLFP